MKKLLPNKTETQKNINTIRCETESKTLMLKLATETHKQKQAREKQKATQRVMGVTLEALKARSFLKEHSVVVAVICELNTVIRA